MPDGLSCLILMPTRFVSWLIDFRGAFSGLPLYFRCNLMQSPVIVELDNFGHQEAGGLKIFE